MSEIADRFGLDWVALLLKQPRTAKSRPKEGPVHAAADAHVVQIGVAVRYAFAMGRRALKQEMRTAAFDETQHPRDKAGQFATVDIAQALSDYKQLTAMGVNMLLRGDIGNEQDRPMLERTIAGMDAAFAHDEFSALLLKDTTVYRGIDSYSVQKAVSAMQPGDEFSDAAFLSTSRSERIARAATIDVPDTSVLLEIVAPKGTRVVAGRRDEKELILNRGTKLRVVEIGHTGEATLLARVRVV